MPFAAEQFFEIFARYNAAIWPAQIAAYAIGAAAFALAWRGGAGAGRAVAALLALMWAWTGVAYHWLAFAPVNPAAWAFGALFLAEAAALLYAGALRGALRFRAKVGARAAFGLVLVVYAMLLYPLVGMAAGHAYPRLPTFGVTPCPVTLFTLALLQFAQPPVPAGLVALPALWSLIGGSAAFLLGVPQDWPLLVAGPVAALTLLRRR